MYKFLEGINIYFSTEEFVTFIVTVADFFIKAVPQSPENMTKESQIPLKQTALAKIKIYCLSR